MVDNTSMESFPVRSYRYMVDRLEFHLDCLCNENMTQPSLQIDCTKSYEGKVHFHQTSLKSSDLNKPDYCNQIQN